VNSTSLIEGLEPEAMRDLVSGFLPLDRTVIGDAAIVAARL
jgi:hypothetical protein